MPKISIEGLRRKLADPTTTADDLKKYFTTDPESAPFVADLMLNEATVDVPQTPDALQRSALLMNWANAWSRMQRRRAFEDKLAGGYDGPIIVSEGDSWFQYPILLEDVIDVLMTDFAVRSLDGAGDTLKDMVEEEEYLDAIGVTGASILLFSGGGNDLLAGGHLADHLRDYESTLEVPQLLLPSFEHVLGEALGWFDRLFKSMEGQHPSVWVIGHAYDHVVPNAGPWLGKPMQSRGIVDRDLQAKLAAYMLDRFHDGLRKLANRYPAVTILDNRSAVKAGQWYDELHPNNAGYMAVGTRFKTAIEGLAGGALRPRPTTAKSGRGAAQAKDRKRGGRQVGRAAIKTAISLHIGLNAVDPAHYQGWEGRLLGCEYDADDMASIALSQGFHPTILKTAAATVEAVTAKVGEAARELHPGGIFFISYSGHGGTLPDFNGDEDDYQDETWCLFDREFVDDEIYFMWRGFKPGVRILVISDSCHSGSVIRAANEDTIALSRIPYPEGTPRLMPNEWAGRVYRANRQQYDEILALLPAGEPQFDRPVTHPLQATVRLISGCQDNQVSMDLPFNGAFTRALLKVWNNGLFQGDYRRFHEAIRREMPATQVPNHWVVGQSNPVFDRQRPFTV
jgi:hypothetical protein